MKIRDMAGVGLPYAIGAKIGKPDKNVILIADKDSLLRQVQELQTAICFEAGESLQRIEPQKPRALLCDYNSE